MNIALIVNNLGNSEQSYEVLQLASKLSEANNTLSPCIFFQNTIPSILEPPCLCMNITGISNFKGKAVAFGMDSASIVINNNTNTENWLVLWDIPWLYTIMNYEACISILSSFNIVVRSESHKKIVENYTGRNDIKVLDDLSELIKCWT